MSCLLPKLLDFQQLIRESEQLLLQLHVINTGAGLVHLTIVNVAPPLPFQRRRNASEDDRRRALLRSLKPTDQPQLPDFPPPHLEQQRRHEGRERLHVRPVEEFRVDDPRMHGMHLDRLLSPPEQIVEVHGEENLCEFRLRVGRRGDVLLPAMNPREGMRRVG